MYNVHYESTLHYVQYLGSKEKRITESQNKLNPILYYKHTVLPR